MFAIIATITTTFLIAEPCGEPSDIFSRLGVPKLETCHLRLHIGEGGEWTVQIVEAYSVEGVNREDLNDFRDPLFELDKYCGSRSLSWTLKKNRMHCRSKGKSNDPLKLASLLVEMFERNKCDYFRWDGRSFEWKLWRQAQLSTVHEEKKSIPELALGMLVTSLVDQAFREIEQELTENGITREEMEAAAQEWGACELVITTSGKITADLPAQVSQDGKTMTLNLTKFLNDPPENWSFRVIGLRGVQATND